ncbi:hypothetical protein RYX36_028952 [Vicia faba]
MTQKEDKMRLYHRGAAFCKKMREMYEGAYMSNWGLRMSNSLVRISIVLFFLIFGYFLALVISLDFNLLGDQVPLVRLVRLLFIRLFGWEVPLIILLCLLSGLDESTLNMMDPAGGQPAANPAAEQPYDGASTSGWRSFEEGVLLQSMPSSNESSKASVNQQPVIPELEPPLLDDNSRREELTARLRANWWGVAYNERILDSFVQSQLSIERHVEAALMADEYSPQVVFERRHTIRVFLFYPEGHALQGGHLRGLSEPNCKFWYKAKRSLSASDPIRREDAPRSISPVKDDDDKAIPVDESEHSDGDAKAVVR